MLAPMPNKQPLQPTQPCVVCREPIAVGAKKCIHCSSFQNRAINSLTTWSSILAAPLALVPLAGIAAALWALTPVGSKGEIEMQLVSCKRDAVQAAFINSGRSPAMVTASSLELLRDGKPVKFETRADPPSIKVINPNEVAYTVTYRPYRDNTPTVFIPANSEVKGCIYRVTASWKDFEGTKKSIVGECGCSD
ncbi:MAG TPA: hypothetical protein VGO04_25450 [Ensifer sp.]|jgi:hypothetical protein|uniref:hypothetical protein n=1 Tax=Ensifer sp. TaxID=1872086 RepID=UPI002E13EB2E|nr:hypothetical protein [Ensifer sp.]